MFGNRQFQPCAGFANFVRARAGIYPESAAKQPACDLPPTGTGTGTFGMLKHAITIPDGVARLFRAVPLRTLVVVALAALVGAAVAIPRYRAATACTPTETVSAPVVQAQAPPPDTPPPTDLPPPAAIATPVENRID